MDEQGLDFPVVLDEQGALAARFGVRGVPASFVLGSGGEIKFKEIGYTTELGLRARMWLAD
jgi:peroxiredoxin